MKSRASIAFKPLISVVIPTYNRASYICDAVDSVLAQNYRNLELIVVNDGSTDETFDILQRYGSDLTLLNEKNRGVSAARNAGIERAQGEYIAYLDSDDLWKPEKLNIFVERLKELENKKCLLFSNIERFNILKNQELEFSQSEIFPFIYDYFDRQTDLLFEAAGDRLIRFLLRRYDIYPSSILLHRDLHNRFRWNSKFKYCEDYMLYLELSSEFHFNYIDQVLTTIRLHDGNATWNSEGRTLGLIRATGIYAHNIAKDDASRRMCNYICGRICKDRAMELMSQRSFLNAFRYFSRLVRYPTFFYDTALRKLGSTQARLP